MQNIGFYLFYDAGIAWARKQIGEQPTKLSATSFGIGTRFMLMPHLSGNLMITQPLTREVAAEELIGQGRKPRVFFQVVMTA